MSPGLIVLSMIVGFLGGSTMSAIISWLRANRSETRERKIQFLNEQLRKLYGPLFFYSSLSDRLSKVSQKIYEVYKDKYPDESDLEIKKRVLQEGINTIKPSIDTSEVLIDYFMEFVKINENIVKILNSNFSYIDPDDVEIFTKFCENYYRWKLETGVSKDKKLELPIIIGKQIGEIYLVIHKFNNIIKLKFYQKKKEISELMGKR